MKILQIREAWQIPRRINIFKNHTRHIIAKLLKIKGEEKVLKQAGKKTLHTTRIRMMTFLIRNGGQKKIERHLSITEKKKLRYNSISSEKFFGKKGVK